MEKWLALAGQLCQRRHLAFANEDLLGVSVRLMVHLVKLDGGSGALLYSLWCP